MQDTKAVFLCWSSARREKEGKNNGRNTLSTHRQLHSTDFNKSIYLRRLDINPSYRIALRLRLEEVIHIISSVLQIGPRGPPVLATSNINDLIPSKIPRTRLRDLYQVRPIFPLLCSSLRLGPSSGSSSTEATRSSDYSSASTHGDDSHRHGRVTTTQPGYWASIPATPE